MSNYCVDSQCHPIALAQVPAPFRRILEERLTDPAAFLLYSPPFKVAHWRRASLLAVTNTGWLSLKEAADGGVDIHHADYGDTLLLEFTTIRLVGELRIDYAAKGSVQSATLEFGSNQLSEYEDAVCRMLGSIDGQPGHFVHHGEIDAQLTGLPPEYHRAALHHLAPGRRLLSIVHWPACLGGNHRWSSEELAPEAMLLLTDRELILISEERARSWLRIGHLAPNYGHIVTFVPLVRLGLCRMDAGGEAPIVALELDLHTAQGWNLHGAVLPSDIVRIGFPRHMTGEVAAFLEQVSARLQPLD